MLIPNFVALALHLSVAQAERVMAALRGAP